MHSPSAVDVASMGSVLILVQTKTVFSLWIGGRAALKDEDRRMAGYTEPWAARGPNKVRFGLVRAAQHPTSCVVVSSRRWFRVSAISFVVILAASSLKRNLLDTETFRVDVVDCTNLRGTYGRWVLDWEFGKRNSYTNYGGGPDANKWHVAPQNFRPTPSHPARMAASFRWIDEFCPLHELTREGFCQVCSELNITRILFAGDSMNQQFLQSLLTLLDNMPEHEIRFTRYTKPFMVNCSDFTLILLWLRISPLSDSLALMSDPNIPAFLAENQNRSLVLFNTGLWIHAEKTFRQSFDSMLRWVQFPQASLGTDRIMLLFRPSLPGHFGCEPKGAKEQID